MDHDLLLSEMNREKARWTFSTKVYGTLYPTFRFYLIVASGVVAAKTELTNSPLASLVNWVPVLALSVSVVTALDTWLKPRDKWRAFMRDRDDLATLLIRGSGPAPPPQADTEVLNTAFAELRRRHRDDNVN